MSNVQQNVTGDRNYVTGTGDIHVTNNFSSVGVEEHRDLNILLSRVKQFWIEGVLDNSVHGAALLELGKEARMDAVEHPWGSVLALPGQPNQTLPLGEKIEKIFEDAGRLLLILGEPGSGKTTTLLELARDLIARAESDPSRPVPVVFNLSTWNKETRGRLEFFEWLVSELSSKYQVPKRKGSAWLENNRLLLLLDGLDEVKEESRASCVEAINAFVEEYGVSGAIVCSRTTEYNALPIRLKFRGAVVLQPLARDQVKTYFDQAGPKLHALRTVLGNDSILQELAQSPLMLSVMSLAYQGMPIEELTRDDLDTIEERREHIFDVYVERMLERKGKEARSYKGKQTKTWLAWLAKKMTEKAQTVFLIEQLQPSWLSNRSSRWAYFFTTRFIVCLLALMIFNGVLLSNGGISIDYLGFSFVTTHLLYSLVTALALSLVDTSRITFLDALFNTKTSPKWLQNAAYFSLYLIASAFVSYGFLLIEKLRGNVGFFGAIFLITTLLLSGVVAALLVQRRGAYKLIDADIQTLNFFSWSPLGAVKGAFWGSFGTMLVLLAFGLLFGALRNMFGNIDMYYVIIFIASAGVFFGGLQGKFTDTRTKPNQGFKFSLVYAGFLGVAAFLVSWLLFSLFNLLIKPGDFIEFSLSLSLAVFVFLWYGGIDVIFHGVIRLSLYRTGKVPYNYARFLNHAVKLIFLQQVGGGYIFIHRLLQEHFAALNEVKGEPRAANTVASPTQPSVSST